MSEETPPEGMTDDLTDPVLEGDQNDSPGEPEPDQNEDPGDETPQPEMPNVMPPTGAGRPFTAPEPGGPSLGALRHRFTYHPPTEGQAMRYEELRRRALAFATYLHDACPASRELTRAFNKLDECVFLANAAIARNE